MRPLRHYLLVIVGLLACAACRSADRPPDGQVVQDALNRSIAIRTPISRIVSLAPSATEMIFAAGAGKLLIGVTISDNHPPAVNALPRVNTYPVDLERIVTLNPDLAFASNQVNHPEQVRTMEALGIPTYFLASQSLDAVLEEILALGQLLGTPERAHRAVDSLQSRVKQLRRATADVAPRPNVLVLAGAQPLYAFGSESYVHELVELAGGISTTGTLSTRTPVLSDEFVLRAAPEVIIGTDSTQFNPETLLALHPTWDVVPAVRNGRVYALNPDLIYRPGPRLVEAAYQIAHLLHPELPENLDP